MSEESIAKHLKLLIDAGCDARIAECAVISVMKHKAKLESEKKKGKPRKK